MITIRRNNFSRMLMLPPHAAHVAYFLVEISSRIPAYRRAGANGRGTPEVEQEKTWLDGPTCRGCDPGRSSDAGADGG